MSVGISVVIPCYNAEPYLGQAIASVAAQTVPDWELIVVDDGSRDGSAAVAAAWAAREGRVRVVTQANAGVAAARNRGYAEASPAAEAVIFLDADDAWEPDALAVLREALEADPGAVAAHGLTRLMTDSAPDDDRCFYVLWGRARKTFGGHGCKTLPLDQPTILDALLFQNCIGTPGQVLIRRAALEAAGDFDAQMTPSEDWDMWLRLARHGHLAFVNQVVLNYRRHAGSLSANPERVHQAEVRVRRKIADFYRDDPRQRRRIETGVAWEHCVDKMLHLRDHCVRREVRPAFRQACAIAGSFARYIRACVSNSTFSRSDASRS